jgi:hypothetical protein
VAKLIAENIVLVSLCSRLDDASGNIRRGVSGVFCSSVSGTVTRLLVVARVTDSRRFCTSVVLILFRSRLFSACNRSLSLGLPKETKFENVMLLVGSNDCTSSSFNETTFQEDYTNLFQVAKLIAEKIEPLSNLKEDSLST